MTIEASNPAADSSNPRPPQEGAVKPQIDRGDIAAQVKAMIELKSVFFHTPLTMDISSRLDQLEQFGNIGRDTKSPSHNLLLTGPSHSGKTSLLRRWETKHVPIVTENITLRPVVFVEILPNSTCKGVMIQTLKALEVPVGTQSADMTALGLRLIEWLRKKQVNVLIFDEFQHIVEEKTKAQIYNGGDLLKSLTNSGTAIVVSGIEEAAAAYDENKALEVRSIGRYHLKPFKWSDPEDRKLYRTLLALYAKELPFPEPSDLAALEIAMPLYHLSGGLFGRTVTLLINAATQALMSGARCVDREVLRKMLESYRDHRNPDWFNAFEVGHDRLRLVPAERDVRNRTTRLRNGYKKSDEIDFMSV